MHPQVLTYDIDEVVPYINWLYFYHAWGMSGKPLAEKQRLRDEASAMMQSWQVKEDARNRQDRDWGFRQPLDAAGATEECG